LPVFDQVLHTMELEHAQEFQSGFIAESPKKLRRIWEYFAAIHGQGAYPPVRCNAPEFSAVVGATGRVQPCFFISGPADVAAGSNGIEDLSMALNSRPMTALRSAIRAGARAECKTCVCSMWRDTHHFESAVLG
jgi:radical SAM protein with 4Fe4S-binding SPASM domain